MFFLIFINTYTFKYTSLRKKQTKKHTESFDLVEKHSD